MSNNKETDTDEQARIESMYRTDSTEQSPERVDRQVLAYSRNVTRKKARVIAPFNGGWPVPLSLAAVVCITVILVLTIEQDVRPPDVVSDESGLVIAGAVAPAETESLPQDNQGGRVDSSEAKELSDDSTRLEVADRARPAAREMASTGIAEQAPAPVKPESAAATKSSQAMSFADGAIVSQLESEIETLNREKAALEDEKQALLTKLEENQAVSRKLSAQLQQNIITGKDGAAGQFSVIDIPGDRAQSAWLNYIHRLWQQGAIQLARSNLADFQIEYPDYATENLQRIVPGEWLSQ